ncbi:MAG: alpha/beta hydrolase fold, partial [uncultured Acetobacteraceae bacterium]
AGPVAARVAGPGLRRSGGPDGGGVRPLPRHAAGARRPPSYRRAHGAERAGGAGAAAAAHPGAHPAGVGRERRHDPVPERRGLHGRPARQFRRVFPRTGPRAARGGARPVVGAGAGFPDAV